MGSLNKNLKILALVLRVALGVIFIYAAWVKLNEPWELFALAISNYQLLPMKAVEFVARALPWFELAVGVLLIAGIWLRAAATATTLLLLGFFVLMVRAFAMGMEIDCGCFGGNDPISWKTLLRDGSMLAASLVLTAMAFLQRRKTA